MQNSEALPKGTILNSGTREYKILSVLGQGGFGITYLAKAYLLVDNIPIEALFAIKEHYISKMNQRQGMSVVISNENNRQEIKESIESFITEAKRLNKISLRHPGIVRVNEYFMANDTAYYVMEYIKGYSVRKYVRQSKAGRLTEDEALYLFCPIAETVGYLHKNKVTHLDIKPDNILIRENGQPVIIDFGLSKHYNSKGTPTSTTKAYGCSDGYSPMEQYAGIMTFTPEADIYALAATLLYMLTGKDPQKSTEITNSIIRNSLPPNISENTVLGILKAMEKLKENRTSKVDKLLSLLPHSENSTKAESNRHTAHRKEPISSGSKNKTRKFGERKRSFLPDWLFDLFKPEKEKIGNKANINEPQESKENQPTTPIDVSRPSPTLITFINEKSLLIYFRGNTYVYGGMHSSEEAFCLVDPYFDVPYHRLPKGKDIYEENNEKLFRLGRKHTSYTILEHIDNYGYLIKKGLNITLYSQIDEFLLLNELCFSDNPLIKVERLIYENQFLVFSNFLDKTGIVRVNVGDCFMDVDYYEKGVFEVLSMGYVAKESPVVNKEITLDTSSILNDIIDGCHEYYNNLIGRGLMPLYPTLPYRISYISAHFALREDWKYDMTISEPYSICPFKEEDIIINGMLDEKGILYMHINDILNGARMPLTLNVRKYSKYIPESIVISVRGDLAGCIIFGIKDYDKGNILGECYIGDLLNEMDYVASVKTTQLLNEIKQIVNMEISINVLPKGTELHKGKRKYKVEKVLGTGGFGITYKVSNIVMVDNVAINTFFAKKEYFLSSCYRGKDNASAYYFWIAAPGTTTPKVHNCIMWKFHHRGKVAGINDNVVDINKYLGTYADLIKFVEKEGVKLNRTSQWQKEMLNRASLGNGRVWNYL